MGIMFIIMRVIIKSFLICFIVNNSRTCTLAKVQTASFELQIQYYISLLNVKFVLQKIVATAGGIYLFMNAFLYKKLYLRYKFTTTYSF